MSSTISAIALLVFVVAVVPTFATDYTVGDTSGWTTGVDYDTWASDKTFNVGDNLLFSYGFLHTVNEVSKDDYDSCSSTNSLQSYSDQSTKITLDKPGPRYFICGTATHCTSGMKLTVNAVSSSDSTPTSDAPSMAPSESGPPTPSTSDTPSTPTESEPSTPSDTPSTPTESEPSTPSTSDTPSTTPTESEPSTPSTTITNTPSQSTPKKNTPTMTGISSAGSNGANPLIAGIAFVGLVGIMG